ncbi:hypothetical protein TNCV_2225851 [Trichonephila clavipes]|nr:hypothetical protein TNCV_2225851 [Trichonephila clavipes]
MCSSRNPRDLKMRETNRSHTRLQLREDDVHSPETCFTGGIVFSKRRLFYQSFAEISVFEAVTKRSTL